MSATTDEWREQMMIILRETGALTGRDSDASISPGWAGRTIMLLIARRSGYESIDYTRWASDLLRADAAAQERDAERARAERAATALRRLVWRGVADDDECTCEPDDVCDLCEAMAVLDHPTRRWPGAEQAAAWLSEQQAQSVLPRRVCDVCGGPSYRCGGRLGHEGIL